MSTYTPNENVMYKFDMTPKFADGRQNYNFSAGPCLLPKAVLDVA